MRVAVVGAGPAGFYACEALLRQETLALAVDLYERLPTPYGLVRGGVAPDHPQIKSVTRLFDRTARRPGFRFLGNVNFGQDIQLPHLLSAYHQVLFCTGASGERRLGCPGEDLPGCHGAANFVGWYNGHPDFREEHFALEEVESAVVVGNGNVALDAARMLLRTPESLARTDVAAHALQALHRSRVRTVYLLGRRGPGQAAFTPQELREICALEGVRIAVHPQAFATEEHAHASGIHAQRNVELLRTLASAVPTPQAQAKQSHDERTLQLLFCVSPCAVLGEDHVRGVQIEHNHLVADAQGKLRAQGSGQRETLTAQLVLRSIGYYGTPLAGLPFLTERGVIPNENGRVVDPQSGRPIPGVYVAGWIKRGPTGVIGTNKADAQESVRTMLEDAQSAETAAQLPLRVLPQTLESELQQRGVQLVDLDAWNCLNTLEVARGKAAGKPREKFVRVDEMLAALQSERR